MKSLNVSCLSVILTISQNVSSTHHPAFVTSVRSNRRIFNVHLGGAGEASDDVLLEAEEAAAVDAHDVSDPGIEGASMERAVMMAAELFEQTKADHHHKPKSSSLFKSIWSYFRHDNEDEIRVVKDAEADYAHDLSVMAAIEHANEI